jgi:hypothetical protein
MNVENLIKGKTASIIVAQLFEQSGYKVYRYGFEGLIETLIQNHKAVISKDSNLTLVSSTPHFVIIDEKLNRLHLVTVKFIGKDSKAGNVFWAQKILSKFWPNTHIVVVKQTSPHFSIVIEEEGEFNFVNIEDFKELKIDEKTAKEFGRLAKIFLAH